MNDPAPTMSSADPDSSPDLRSAGEFETLIAEISGRFVTLPPEEIDEAVTAALEHIQAVLEQTGWRIRGAGAAAEILGLKPTTLESRMKKLGIQRP